MIVKQENMNIVMCILLIVSINKILGVYETMLYVYFLLYNIGNGISEEKVHATMTVMKHIHT